MHIVFLTNICHLNNAKSKLHEAIQAFMQLFFLYVHTHAWVTWLIIDCISITHHMIKELHDTHQLSCINSSSYIKKNTYVRSNNKVWWRIANDSISPLPNVHRRSWHLDQNLFLQIQSPRPIAETTVEIWDDLQSTITSIKKKEY